MALPIIFPIWFHITPIMLNGGKRKIINTIDLRSDKLSPYKKEI